MAEEKTLSSQSVYAGRAMKLRVDTVQMPGGRETTREIVEHSDCVAIIAIDADDKVLLVSQFRQAVGKELARHPLVKSAVLAPPGEGGDGATIVTL